MLLGAATGGARERAGESRRGDPERVGIVDGVVMAREVPLEHLGEPAVQLGVGVVLPALLRPCGVVPALDPQQHDREQVALQVGAARVGRAAALVGERGDHRVEALGVGRRHLDDPRAAPAEQPRRGKRRAGAVVQQLVAEAHDGGVEVVGALEHVDAVTPDQRDRAGAHRDRLPVDRVLAGSAARPEQLVVGVPVRRAGAPAVRAERPAGDLHDLQRRAGVRQAVDGEGGHAATVRRATGALA